MSKYRQYNTGIQDKSEKMMTTIAKRAAFYRENPNRFVKDYLGIELKLFQEIILVMMNYCTNSMFLAARGYKWLPYTEMYKTKSEISVEASLPIPRTNDIALACNA